MFDELEVLSVERAPRQTEDVKALFSGLRKKMQGGAAVVIEIVAEHSYAYEKGLAFASDVVGLLRFFSPASNRFWWVCPNALLGAESIPQSFALLLSENGDFSHLSEVVPKRIALWRLYK
jgi:hypothetical protein